MTRRRPFEHLWWRQQADDNKGRRPAEGALIRTRKGGNSARLVGAERVPDPVEYDGLDMSLAGRAVGRRADLGIEIHILRFALSEILATIAGSFDIMLAEPHDELTWTLPVF